MKKPKVALIHDFLVQYGGAEKTLEALLELFPEAPVYTCIYKPDENFPKELTSRTIHTPKTLNKLFNAIPIFSSYFTFLSPMAVENFNLDEFDIVISDSAAYAKGVLTKPNQLHISYIHTPPRFLYKYSVESTKRTAWYYAPVVTVVDHVLRLWDYLAAQRPDYLLANSNEIKSRIKKFYTRDATVIYPPVELAHTYDTKPSAEFAQIEDNSFYLIAGRQAAYKNFDVVIKVFNELPNYKLIVVGTGPENKRLKKLAGSNTVFAGRVSDADKHFLMGKCKGFINPVKDEDFGIVPIEVLSHGKPVLAHGSAGHLETVINGVSGMYFDKVSVEHIKKKLIEFDKEIDNKRYDANKLKQTTEKYSKDEFKRKFSDFVQHSWKAHQEDA